MLRRVRFSLQVLAAAASPATVWRDSALRLASVAAAEIAQMYPFPRVRISDGREGEVGKPAALRSRPARTQGIPLVLSLGTSLRRSLQAITASPRTVQGRRTVSMIYRYCFTDRQTLGEPNGFGYPPRPGLLEQASHPPSGCGRLLTNAIILGPQPGWGLSQLYLTSCISMRSQVKSLRLQLSSKTILQKGRGSIDRNKTPNRRTTRDLCRGPYVLGLRFSLLLP